MLLVSSAYLKKCPVIPGVVLLYFLSSSIVPSLLLFPLCFAVPPLSTFLLWYKIFCPSTVFCLPLFINSMSLKLKILVNSYDVNGWLYNHVKVGTIEEPLPSSHYYWSLFFFSEAESCAHLKSKPMKLLLTSLQVTETESTASNRCK